VILVGLVPREAQERMTTPRGAPFRLETWKGALRLAATSPLVGHGLGAFHDAYPRFKRDYGIVRVEHAENDYLETLAETGAVGLGLVLAGLGWLLSAGGRGIAEGRDAAAHGIGQGALAAPGSTPASTSTCGFERRAAALAGPWSPPRRACGRPRRPPALAPRRRRRRLAVQPARAPGGWTSARQEVVAAASAQTQAAQHLRLERARTALGAVLRRRPAHAESWLMLGGVEQALGRHATAVAFARHAAWLDPERPGLKDAVAAIEASP
jgi:hypothetical protein